MNRDERFVELWNDYLEGEIDESGITELRTLVAEDDRLLEMAADSYQLHRLLGLIAQDSESRQAKFVGETMARLPADNVHFAQKVMQHLSQLATKKVVTPRSSLSKLPWAVTAAMFVVVVFSLFFQQPSVERKIATITGLSGSLQWIGDGGRVIHDLETGAKLSGGTIEGLTPDSWFELKFNDSSTVTISGNSMLTFSDHEQKKLYLKEGNVSSNVKPQPKGRPMLIYTRSALLEVLGTQFEVEAGLSETTLKVSEGNVRVKRLSDGNVVDVPAKHRVTAAADRDMLPLSAPDAVHHWKSQLHLGPDSVGGKWSPKTNEQEAKLRAVPYTIFEGKTIYAASIGVTRGDEPPVILQPTSRFKVRGHIASSNHIYFGVTLRHRNGEFAGNFQTIRPASEFQGGEDFEAILDLQDFELDPLLIKWKDKLPSDPFHLVVESIWCHTLYNQVGLVITEIELISPTEEY